ncbi:MAG: hypothetical protein ACI4V1_08010 [Eubacteriales bacterium]
MNQKKKQRLGALDVFIIAAVLVCAVSVGLRLFMTRTSELDKNVQLDPYIVSFKVMGIRDSSANNYLIKGTNFYLEETGGFFGTLREGVTINDAKAYYEMPDGSIVLAANNSSGDLYRVDAECSLDVTGKLDANGCFLLGGNRYLGINKEVKIYSKYLAITVLITDITKAQ